MIRNGSGYYFPMDEAERPDQPSDGLWRETLSSLALIGSTLLLVLLISVFGPT